MPQYRRNFAPGGTFFFTVVTAGRQPILTTEPARRFLRHSIETERRSRPFDIVAFVLLPDHLHAIWKLPPGDGDFSSRWKHIKGAFTHGWLEQGGGERWIRPGQAAESRRGVWQPRFFEHTIRDEDDLIAHVEYVHYNPVKHGLVARPHEWPWSSFHRYVRDGVYPRDWCCGSDDRPASCEGINEELYE